MRPYDEIERDVHLRQAAALGWAGRQRLQREAGAPPPGAARRLLARRLRGLAAWIDGSAAAAGSVTLRPS